MIQWLEKNPFKVIFISGILMFMFHMNLLPVTIMEARNFITAREMITDGNWLLTTMNDLPRYQKPPLPSWLTAVSGMIFGINNVAGLRIPTMLMAVVLCWVMFLFSFKLSGNKKYALICALILMTSFYIVAITNEAPWDIYNHAFMLAGIYFLFRFFKDSGILWKEILLAAVFSGLSFMSKGPISLYALFIPFLIAYGITFKYTGLKKKTFPLIIYIALACIIGLWWFIYVRWADPEAFLAITKKETGNWSSYNVRPFYYYWSFFTQSGIWTILAFVSLLYPYLKNRVADKKNYLFSFLWTLLSVILLSVIPEKKTRYLVPVLIPLALNISFYIRYIIENFKDSFSKREKFPVYFHFGIIAFIGVAFPFVAYFILKDDLNGLWFYFISSSIIIFLIGLLIFRKLRKKQIQEALFLSIVFVITVKVFAFPLSKVFQKNSAFNSVHSLNIHDKDKPITIYSFGEIAPEAIWHYGKVIPLIENTKDFQVQKDFFGVLVNPKEEKNFKRSFEGNFQIELKEVFDLNYNASPDGKKRKNRLVSHFYLVKKHL